MLVRLPGRGDAIDVRYEKRQDEGDEVVGFFHGRGMCFLKHRLHIIPDTWIVYDNFWKTPMKLAFGIAQEKHILNQNLFQMLKKKAGL